MKCLKNEGVRILTSEKLLDLSQKTTEDEVSSEREVFWEVNRQRLLREIEEK